MDWLNRNEYPFESRFFRKGENKLHYIDEGTGEVLLFVHGTPSWSFDFRKVIDDLRTRYRCIAMDHLGFGLSDKPGDYPYSLEDHAKNIEALISHLGITHFTLVLHDFGGPIGFNYAIKHPSNVKGFVVLNSWLWSSADDPDFRKMKTILNSPLLPFLYLYLNFSARFLMPASFGKHKMHSAIRKQYTAPFPDKKSRQGTLAFAKSLLNDQQWFQSLWESRGAVSEKPVLFVWGMRDKVVKQKYLQKFRSGFVNHTVVEIQDAGHFPQEENPELVSNAIQSFMNRLIENNGTVSIDENALIEHKLQ